MRGRKTYGTSYILQSNEKCTKLSLFCCFFLLSFITVSANDYFKEIPLEPINEFDEVPVEIIVSGYLRFEADVIITDTQLVYINVEELFKNLGISCEVDNDRNILKGFIENEQTKYTIDFNSKQIIKNGNIIKSVNGIVKELGAIYVETRILNEAFGLNMLFNFRTLSIILKADFELPLVKQARLEKVRQNVTKLQSKEEIVIDKIIDRDYHLFNGGALDWSISSNQQEGEKTNNRFSLGLGSELLFGEANISFNYYDQTKLDRRQLYYNWRWVDNDNSYIKQAQIGKIGSQSIAFLGAPVVGASFNNSPNTIREAKGTYTISEYTEPNWTVELYINDILVDYTEADASGLYVFNVPIVYGYTTLKMKYFGPLGEERIEEKIMNTPYTLMPAKVLEYNVSGGMLEDEDNSTFGRGEINYGVNRFITIGGGAEYLSRIVDNPLIPFANISFQPFSRMMINMEYAHNVSLKGLLNFNLGRSAFLEVDYSKFVEGQQATLNNTNEERKFRLSLPFKIKKISVNSKLSFNQYLYNVFEFNQLDAFFSGRYKNYSANASIASNWVGNRDPFMSTTLAFSRRTRNGFILRPSVQYNITNNKMMRYRAEIEKRVSKMSFSASYERNIQYATDNVFFSFRYDLPNARLGFSTSYSNDKLNFSENAQGSLAFGGDNYVRSGNNSALGKGGILCYPFVDLNQNGKKDKGEKLVLLKNVRVSGGKAMISEKDSIVRISDLNAFINYNVTFSNNDLDNISWRFKHNTYQILVDPNQYKKVDIPIEVMGEVSGMVYLKNNDNLKAQGRITIQVYNSKREKVAEVLSESDGYFSYLGLPPGNYNVSVDASQLDKLGYQATPLTQNIVIKPLVDGDIVEGLNFELKTRKQK
ncbi:carboxypeptidase-like regulatory domain-containing protein [uncultured Lutibacter sp.]|uniref:carboxypeptidase-like regulatory domain-containing protein n=1 Tax=uncultured Lutibacter sp. TaxID=437739 RepID=UPI002601A2CD|nr:carboxypeptidase-like regulatory domain-containing protein [uncultured Lutibacter sp.]